jgi:hypothetical protein
MKGAVLLLDGESCEPDGNQPVLPVRLSKSWMGGDFQEEMAVAPSIDELVFRWLAQGKAAQYEGPRIVTDLLHVMFSLVSDELNGLQLFESLLGDTNMREQGSYGCQAGLALIFMCMPSFRKLEGEAVVLVVLSALSESH